MHFRNAGAWPGYVSVNRSGATAWSGSANGVSQYTGGDASTQYIANSMKICANDASSLGFGVNTLAFACFGAAMTAAQDAAIAAAVAAFATAV